MPNIRWLLKLITVVNRFVFQLTGGRIGGRLGKVDVLLLETVGRRSGKRRVTPLLFIRDDERFVVVASNAGDDRPPAWWLNLQSQPSASVQVRDRHHAVKARVATPEERERLWPKLLDAYRSYDDYVKRTSRTIPVVVLEPA